MEQISVLGIARKIQDEAGAYAFMEDLRWGKDLSRQQCPHCNSTRKFYFLKPKNGTSRATRTGSASQRRVWKCADCRKQFSVITNTIFHGTKVSLHIWLFVIFEMCANKNGIAAREIERKYDVTPKTAWFMTQRIREAMKKEPLAGMLSGTIIADETHIGGKPKNKHRQGTHGKKKYGPGKGAGAGGNANKTVVLSLLDKATGEVRSKVIPDVTGATLADELEAQIDMANTHLHTDGATGYRQVGKQFASHEYVDHSTYEYVRGDVTTNHVEGFFSQLKRSLDGTHHHVSRKHLHRYLAEFDYRYSSRQDTDTERMSNLMRYGVGGRRLSYRPVAD